MRNRLPVWEKCLVAGFIAIAGIVMVLVVRRESVTMDEVIHITAGVSYLQQHEERLNLEHPPLEKLLAAFPLVIAGAKQDYELAAWQSPDEGDFCWATMRGWGLGGERKIFLARLPMIALTLVFAFTTFWMARTLGGSAGGMVSLLLFVTSPFFYAYGPLVMTDIGVAFFSILTVWTFASLWERPNLKYAVLFGLAFSGALLSKFSAGLLLPTLVLLGLWFKFRPIDSSFNWRRATLFSLLGTGFACAIVYAAYAVIFWKSRAGWLLSYRFEHSTHHLRALGSAANMLQAHPWMDAVLSPVILYCLGVGLTLRSLARPTYLLGRVYPHGTLWYFPTQFLYKMTPGFLCLTLLLICLLIWKRIGSKQQVSNDGQDHILHVRALGLTLFIFTLAAVASPLNLGIRHISVSIAALTVLISLVVPWSAAIRNVRAKVIVRILGVIAIVVAFVSIVTAFPDYIGYLNVLKGSRASYEITADSDMGQLVIELRDFMRKHQVGAIMIDMPGSVSELYLPAAQEFNCDDGVPADAQWLALGATRFVSARDFKLDPAKPVFHCTYLLNYPHWVSPSGSLYVFHVNHQRRN